MSGAPRVRAINVADSEARPVLGPAGNGNKTGSLIARKPGVKPMRQVEKSAGEQLAADNNAHKASMVTISPKLRSVNVPSVLRRHEQLLHSNLSLNASCSSDASTDSFHSRASTGRLTRSNSVGSRRKPSASKPRSVTSDGSLESPPDGLQTKKRCAWLTSNAGGFFLLWSWRNSSIFQMVTVL